MPRRACILGTQVCRFLAEARDETNLQVWRCCHPGGGFEVDPHDAESVCGMGETIRTSARMRKWRIPSDLLMLKEEMAKGRGWTKRAAVRLGVSPGAVDHARRALLPETRTNTTPVAKSVLARALSLYHEARMARQKYARFCRENGVKQTNARTRYWQRMRRADRIPCRDLEHVIWTDRPKGAKHGKVGSGNGGSADGGVRRDGGGVGRKRDASPA
jgi:hypothetical protein